MAYRGKKRFRDSSRGPYQSYDQQPPNFQIAVSSSYSPDKNFENSSAPPPVAVVAPFPAPDLNINNVNNNINGSYQDDHQRNVRPRYNNSGGSSSRRDYEETNNSHSHSRHHYSNEQGRSPPAQPPPIPDRPSFNPAPRAPIGKYIRKPEVAKPLRVYSVNPTIESAAFIEFKPLFTIAPTENAPHNPHQLQILCNACQGDRRLPNSCKTICTDYMHKYFGVAGAQGCPYMNTTCHYRHEPDIFERVVKVDVGDRDIRTGIVVGHYMPTNKDASFPDTPSSTGYMFYVEFYRLKPEQVRNTGVHPVYKVFKNAPPPEKTTPEPPMAAASTKREDPPAVDSSSSLPPAGSGDVAAFFAEETKRQEDEVDLHERVDYGGNESDGDGDVDARRPQSSTNTSEQQQQKQEAVPAPLPPALAVTANSGDEYLQCIVHPACITKYLMRKQDYLDHPTIRTQIWKEDPQVQETRRRY